MGTKDVRITLTDERHSELKDAKGDRTWRDVLEAGAEALRDDEVDA
jgi:hypothetical protein